jgi:bifunctional DNase/RNase
MESDGLSEMVVESVRVHMLSSQHVVILKELGRERYLPIWVGPWEANAIAMKLQDLKPERPLTHDLFVSTLERLGATLRQVVVSDLADETFRARMYLEVGGRALDVDARPSDAIALAIRGGVSIYATQAVLDRAGVEPEPDSEEEGGDQLAVFRDFVNSLDIDLGDTPGSGGSEGRPGR